MPRPSARAVRVVRCAAVVIVAAACTIAGMTRAEARPAPTPGKECTLPVTPQHTPPPFLTARLNPDQTVSVSGETCPGALVTVFTWHGSTAKGHPASLVYTARPDKGGHFTCTLPYHATTKFGVIISGVYVVSLQAPIVVRHALPRVAPATGFGGLAWLVAGHHPASLVVPRHSRVR